MQMILTFFEEGGLGAKEQGLEGAVQVFPGDAWGAHARANGI